LQVLINGETKTLTNPLSLAELIDHLDLTPARIAVELNREVIRRSLWSETKVKDGDRIEIVHFVGGGFASVDKEV
jgi:thiamine biosynthesis protein ThiS